MVIITVSYNYSIKLNKYMALKSDLLLYGRDMLGLNLPFSKKLWGDPSLEQHALSGHLHENETNQLTHVHATDHLLKSVVRWGSRGEVDETQTQKYLVKYHQFKPTYRVHCILLLMSENIMIHYF